MSLLGLLIVLVIFGVVLYLVNYFLPIDPKIKLLINVVLVIFVIVWLLQVAGMLGSLESVRI